MRTVEKITKNLVIPLLRHPGQHYSHPGLDPGSQSNTVIPAIEPESLCTVIPDT
jgi:hypothetical protein